MKIVAPKFNLGQKVFVEKGNFEADIIEIVVNFHQNGWVYVLKTSRGSMTIPEDDLAEIEADLLISPKHYELLVAIKETARELMKTAKGDGNGHIHGVSAKLVDALNSLLEKVL